MTSRVRFTNYHEERRIVLFLDFWIEFDLKVSFFQILISIPEKTFYTQSQSLKNNVRDSKSHFWMLLKLLIIISGQRSHRSQGADNPKFVALFPLGFEKCREVRFEAMVDWTSSQSITHTPRGLANHTLMLPIQGTVSYYQLCSICLVLNMGTSRFLNFLYLLSLLVPGKSINIVVVLQDLTYSNLNLSNLT